MAKILQPAGMYQTVADRVDQCAVRFMVMAAIGKTAMTDKWLELAETALQLPRIHAAQSKTANPGRVDEFSALGHAVQGGCGGGVPSHAGGFRQATCLNVDIGQ